MEIYHGSYTPIPSPEIIPREFTKDFGEGFYCIYDNTSYQYASYKAGHAL